MTDRPDGRWPSEPAAAEPAAVTGQPGGTDRIPITAGLCARCVHARRLVSGRGSVFVLCKAASSDPLLARYPNLPRWRCRGFQKLDASRATVDVHEQDSPPPTRDDVDEGSSWVAVFEGFHVRAVVPAAQALLRLLEGCRSRWKGKVAVGWSMHELWFTRIGDPFAITRAEVAWSAGVFEFRLVVAERGWSLIAADRCFEPNAQIVLDAFLYQLTRETAV